MGAGCAGRFLSLVKASAPGKIILFGEHAVVYGRPALAIPVMQVHADVEVLDSSRTGVWIHAPGINLHAELNTLPSDHPIAFVINKVFASMESPSPFGRGTRGEGGLSIKITSTIPFASGLGSGAAVSVALIRALSEYLGQPLSDEQVNTIAYETEKLYHGTPSGIDNTVITYAMPVYFVKDQSIEVFKVGAPFTIVIGDTGIAAPTRESVGDVRKLWEADKEKWEKVFDGIASIVGQARLAVESGHGSSIGPLMNLNHNLLQKMTVSSPELDRLVQIALQAGALGAKMSGGGRGGNMIALVQPEDAEKISAALISAGARRTIITLVQ